MFRRRALITLISLIAVCTTTVVPGAAWAARDVTSLKQRAAAFEARSAHLDALAGEAASRHNLAMDRVQQARDDAAQSRRALATSRSALMLAGERLSQRISTLYRHPDPGLVEVIVSSGSISDLMAGTEALRAAATDDARLALTMRRRSAELAAAQDQLARAIVTARAGEREASREAARVKGLAKAQRMRLEQVRGDLRAELRVRRAGTTRAAASVGTSDPVLAAPGTEPVFPVAAPTTFSDDWLQARGGGRLHEGIDLMAAMQAPIVAVVTGTVMRPGNTPISGNRLWVRGANGDEYFYCHLDSFAEITRDGASVKAGDVVGYVGMTGDAQGTVPHLHFEIHPAGGGPIRPYPLVSAWPRVG